jgi:isoleucyl-tRNA synthetase
VELLPGDYEISSEDMPGWLVATDGPLTLALDIEVNDDLRREGVARELVNRIQNLRKDSGFEVTDRVKVDLYADGAVREALAASLAVWAPEVAAQTLAESVTLADGPAPEGAAAVEWDEGPLKIKVIRK